MAQNYQTPVGYEQQPSMINTHGRQPPQSQYNQFSPQQGPPSHNSTPADRYRPATSQQISQQPPQQLFQQSQQSSARPSSPDSRFAPSSAANGAIYDHAQGLFVSQDYRDRHEFPFSRAEKEQEKEDEDNRTRRMEYTDPYNNGKAYVERVPREDIHRRHDPVSDRGDSIRGQDTGAAAEPKSKTHRVADKVKAVTSSAVAADYFELASEGLGRAA